MIAAFKRIEGAASGYAPANNVVQRELDALRHRVLP
jgi:hypothetical protein